MYKRLLIPTDGTPLSAAAEDAGIALARSIGASVVGFAVAAPPSQAPFPAGPSEAQEKWGNDRLAAARRLEALLNRVRIKAESAGVAFAGRAVLSDCVAAEIVDAASRNDCDLIYMGTRGTHGIGRLLGGSVAMEVVALSDIPVTLCTRSRQDAAIAL